MGTGVASRCLCRLAILLGLLVPAGAAAQAEPVKPLRFTADLGFVSTGGNTDLVTLSLNEKVEWRVSPRLDARQVLKWVYGKTDGVESANQLLAGWRADVRLADGLSVHGGVNYDYDLFAGIKRRFEELAGLGYQPVQSEHHRLKLELGISLFQETATTDEVDNFVAGRAATEYRFLFGPKAYAQHAMELLPNFDNGGDYRFNSETALVAPLNGILAIRVSYLVRYRGEPPEGFGTTDTTLRTGIQVTL